MFMLFDASGDGAVSITEYVDTMVLFGIVNIDIDFVRSMLREYDDSAEDIEIDFIEFISMMAADSDTMQTVVKANLVGFREAFKLFDKDDSGSVTNDEFIQAWRELGFEASDEEVSGCAGVKMVEYNRSEGVGGGFELCDVGDCSA